MACCASGDDNSSAMLTDCRDEAPERALRREACELERLATDGE
jgi:hypothetical protein